MVKLGVYWSIKKFKSVVSSILLGLLLAGNMSCRDVVSTDTDNSPVEYTTWSNHTKFFVAPGALHGELDCNICHGAFDTFKKFDCLVSGCHSQTETDTIHSTVTDYVYESNKCYSCHPAGENDAITREDHTATKFPIDNTDTHGDVSCISCHTDVTQFADVDCLSCHTHGESTTDSQHTNLSTNSYGYSYTSASCLKCHANSDVHTINSHQFYFPISSGEHRVSSYGCTNCHNSQRTDRSYTAADFTKFSCLGACHEHGAGETNSNHNGVGGYSSTIYTSEDFSPCVTCHPNGTGDD
jgi:nitrate/TMAO reductase-like tetraheme cytochrome c subunit